MEVWDDFGHDWERLPRKAQAALAAFLEQLQRNPYDPEIQRTSVVGDNERSACEFYPGYFLYWRVDCESISVSKVGNMTITLLGIRTRR